MMFGSLFSGIGGIDLGLQRAGMEPAWHSEIEPYACRVLAKHWPEVPNLGDIRDIDWTRVAGVDLVAGGYPCQPFSYAGSRNGEEDSRHLWPMFAECIRVVRPRYALLENVAGHLSLGFGSVLADLAALGYHAQWDCIPAAAVGAPHIRDRVFIIATRRTAMDTDSHSEPGQPVNGSASPWPSPMADTNCSATRHELKDNWQKLGEIGRAVDSGCHCRRDDQPTDRATMANTNRSRLERAGYAGPTADRGGQNGAAWATEPGVGRVAHGIPRRVDRLRGLGNAVVPQVAEHVGRIIMSMEAAR